MVTGASRGIGAATAAAFALQGAAVYANFPDADTEHHRDAVDQWRRGAGIDRDRVFPIAADVSDSTRVDAMYAAIAERFDGIDVLVNNAGINRDRTVAKMTNAEWRQVLAVNLDGMFYNCRAALPLLRDNGRIINVSSMVAYTGNFGVANYAASKAGVLGLTRTLALELAARNITVNAVCPGLIDTPMSAGIPEHALNKMMESIPLKRKGAVPEVTACILFLASGHAGYITGQDIGVNGGLYMG